MGTSSECFLFLDDSSADLVGFFTPGDSVWELSSVKAAWNRNMINPERFRESAKSESANLECLPQGNLGQKRTKTRRRLLLQSSLMAPLVLYRGWSLK